jgi:flagellar motility protein MotE (MotC chaperone)
MKEAMQEKTKKYIRKFELLFLKHMRVVPSMIFVAVLLFGAKLLDLLTFQELREGTKSGLVAGEVAQPPAEMSAASLKNKADGQQKPTEAQKSDFSNVDVNSMTPQKYQLIREVEEGNRLRFEGNDEKIAKTEALEAVEARVEKKINELSQVEEKAKAATNTKVQKDEEERKTKLLRLIKISEGLGPKEAAAILEGVEFPILIELMSHIKESKASAILSKMAPEKASYLISALGRKMEGNDLMDAGYHSSNERKAALKTASSQADETSSPPEGDLPKEDKPKDLPSKSIQNPSRKETSSKASSKKTDASSKELEQKTSVDNSKGSNPEEKSAKKGEKKNDQKKAPSNADVSLDLPTANEKKKEVPPTA